MSTDPVGDVARAILDGAAVDWPELESSADPGTRALAGQLKVLAAIGDLHRREPTPASAESPGPNGGPDTADDLGSWGPLRLLEHVGEGAFGDVYRAWDTRLDREVALKLLTATASHGRGSPVIEEGRLLARVRHPNVATIYGAELIDGRIGLWMEFIHGNTLEALLRSGHVFSVQETIAIGIELAHALSAVHASGLLHRDVKAQNVMRGEDGRVVLMDFGTGLDQSADGAAPAGTPLYLAPEVLRGEPATERSDVYSAGVLLYHLLTDAYPVEAPTLQALRDLHTAGAPVDLETVRPNLPPALVGIIRRALDRDPATRHESANALAEALATVERRSRRQWLVVVAGAAVVSVAAWAGWDARGQLRATQPFGAPNTSAGGIGGLPAALPAVDPPAIAVLPFENLSANSEGDLIVAGLTHELIRQLGLIDGLEVRSSTSAFALGSRHDLAETGRQLNVNLVLEGSVLGSGPTWRVNVQLARVDGDVVTPLMSRTFDEATGMFAVLDEISLAVVNRLRLTLGRGQRRYDLDAETSDLYLKARALAERRGTPNASEAAALFERVIARDPTFAPAYAGLADAYAFMSTDLPDVGGLPPDRALALMRPAAERAIALDPLLADAHAATGIVHSREFDWPAAEASFRRAIELNPNLTHAYTSFSVTTLKPLGRFDEAETLLREALRRDPLSLTVLRDLADVRLEAGRYDEAIRDLRAILAVDGDLPYVSLFLARALTFAGRVDEAMPIWDTSDLLGWQHWKAYAYVRAGRRAEVEAMIERNRNPYWLTMIHAALGNTDLAIEALEQAADQVPQRVVWLLNYPEMAPLRKDARFQAIRARFHLPCDGPGCGVPRGPRP
jgi:TolB-like protein